MVRMHRAQSSFTVRVLLALGLLAALAWVYACAEEQVYFKNAWNFVDGSMDISGGIPADALGRLGRIRDAGRLVVATSPDFPPQEFLDESKTGQDRFVGADIELARRIAERMGVELEIRSVAFADLIGELSHGEIDLAISALSFTEDRASLAEMSKGYYFTDETVSSGIMIRQADADVICTVDDLATRDIAAQSGSLQESMAADEIVFYRQFRRLETTADVYEAVIDGTVDAAIVDLENARLYMEIHPEANLTIIPDINYTLRPEFEGNRVAGPKGEIQLMYFVNGVIDEVLASDQYNQWFREYADYAQGKALREGQDQ